MQKNEVMKNYRFLAILIGAMILGCVVGWLAPGFATTINPLGKVFINMMFCIVVPLVFASIAGSIAGMKSKKRAGKILGTTVVTFVVTGAIAAVIMFILMKIFPPVLTPWENIEAEEMGEYATVTNSFLFSLAISSSLESASSLPSASDQLYARQANYILDLVQRGPCIIVGRCADYILRDHPDTLHAFIYADMDFRVKHMAEHYGKDEAAAPKWLRDKDNRRKVYYKHYTGRNWGDPHNYDICLCTSLLGIERAANILADIAKLD